MTPSLKAQDLAKRFGRNVLFRGLSFDLTGGQSLAITGPNGSGKSTLVQILAAVLTADRGRVTLHDGTRELKRSERPLHVGLVAPYLNVYDGLSAYENLQFLARTRGLPDAESRIDALLARVGLPNRKDDLVSTFSSGMKQRVKFAAALIADPPLLLLDEPSTNLDEAGLKMVEQIMTEHLEAGRLLIVATNDPVEAQRCGDVLRIPDFTGDAQKPASSG